MRLRIFIFAFLFGTVSENPSTLSNENGDPVWWRRSRSGFLRRGYYDVAPSITKSEADVLLRGIEQAIDERSIQSYSSSSIRIPDEHPILSLDLFAENVSRGIANRFSEFTTVSICDKGIAFPLLSHVKAQICLVLAQVEGSTDCLRRIGWFLEHLRQKESSFPQNHQLILTKQAL